MTVNAETIQEAVPALHLIEALERQTQSQVPVNSTAISCPA